MAGLVLILFLVALSYFILPYKALKQWQRQTVADDSAGRRYFRPVWIAVLGVILLLSADAIWSNLSAFRLYTLSEHADKALDELNLARGRMAGLASDAQTFLTGLQSSMVGAVTDGAKDLRPMISLGRQFAGQATEFSRLLKSNLTILNQKLDSHGVALDQVKDLLLTVNMIDTDAVLAKLQEVSKGLGVLGGTASAEGSASLASPFQQGIASLIQLWPPLDHIRPAIQQVGDVLQQEEVVRLCTVFALLTVLLCASACGFQFSRLRRFRILWICMIVLILVLSGLYLVHAYHLVVGTLTGALCDAALSQEASGGSSIKLSTIDGQAVLSGDLYAMARKCNAGHDLPAALLAALQSKTGSVITLGNDLALDHQNQQVTIKTGLSNIILPIGPSHRAEYQKAATQAIEAVLGTAGSAIQNHATQAMDTLDTASRALTETNFDAVSEGLRQLTVLLSTLSSSTEKLPFPLRHYLQEFKVKAMAQADDLQKGLQELRQVAPEMSAAIMGVRNHVANLSSDTFMNLLKTQMTADTAHFVANSLEPAMNCTAAGKAVSDLYDATCGASRAFQSLFVSLGLLLICAWAVIVLHFMARRYADPQ